MNKFILTLSAVAVLSFIPGCCCDKTCAAGSQNCTVKEMTVYGNWTIEDLPCAAAKKIKPAPNAGIVFQKEKDAAKVYGCAGDNRFFGNVEIKGNKLAFSQMGMTRMMGPNAAYEGLFMEALNQVKQYAVIKGKMCLLDQNGKAVIILKQAAQNKGK